MFDLSGKNAIVTGGYGHLGAAMVNALRSVNATVIVAGRSKDKFDHTFGSDSKIIFTQCDITLSDDINHLVSNTVNQFGSVDILINNAATVAGNSIEQMPDNDWSNTLEGVLGSVHKGIRAVIPYMKKQGSGKIVNIASMYGVVSPNFDLYADLEEFTNPPHYGAAKAAIIQLTKYYAAYLGKYNVQVNAISPGPFPTESVQNRSDRFTHRLAERTMLKRIGEPENIKGPVVLLSSKASDFITAHNLIVDGGWTAW